MLYHWLFVLVWLDASDKEGVAEVEGLHERLQRLFELGRQGGSSLPGL